MDLEKDIGKLINTSELAKFLDIDVRTVKKYAKILGGIELIPGRYYHPRRKTPSFRSGRHHLMNVL